MTIKLDDVQPSQFDASVQKHSGGIEGIGQALQENPMPADLLETLQKGINAGKGGHGRG